MGAIDVGIQVLRGFVSLFVSSHHTLGVRGEFVAKRCYPSQHYVEMSEVVGASCFSSHNKRGCEGGNAWSYDYGGVVTGSGDLWNVFRMADAQTSVLLS